MHVYFRRGNVGGSAVHNRSMSLICQLDGTNVSSRNPCVQLVEIASRDVH